MRGIFGQQGRGQVFMSVTGRIRVRVRVRFRIRVRVRPDEIEDNAQNQSETSS